MAATSKVPGQHNAISTQRYPGTALLASETRAAIPATAASPVTVRAEAAVASGSGEPQSVAAADSSNRSNFLEQKMAAAGTSSAHAPETIYSRDGLFAGISETGLEEGDDDSAEVVIEPDGRIKVHPRRRPGYLRYGGALEPSAFDASIEADHSAVERDARAAKDLLLLRLLRSSRQTRSDRGSALDSFIEEEIGKLLMEEITVDRGGLLSLAELKAGNHADPDSSPMGDSYAKSRVLTSSAGYFIAFIVGFGGILLIAMLCCVIRAVYVKRQKALLKKLLAEKLGDAAVEKPKGADLTTPVVYEVIDNQEHAAPLSDGTAAETEWIDVRVDQQAPPEEEQLMDVARLDTISKTRESPEAVEDKGFEQLPYKSKKDRQKGAVVSSWKDEKLEQRDPRDKRKSAKKLDKDRRSGSTVKEKEGNRKATTHRGKDLKKVLSSRRTMRQIG